MNSSYCKMMPVINFGDFNFPNNYWWYRYFIFQMWKCVLDGQSLFKWLLNLFISPYDSYRWWYIINFWYWLLFFMVYSFSISLRNISVIIGDSGGRIVWSFSCTFGIMKIIYSRIFLKIHIFDFTNFAVFLFSRSCVVSLQAH